MDGSAGALRPLDEAAEAIDRLESYETTAELASAIETVRAAVERALRLRLRSEPSAPDSDRLSAMSRDLPADEIVRRLRTRDLISLETAGSVHELEAAGTRARAGDPRPSDADVALRAAARLREAADRLAAFKLRRPGHRRTPGAMAALSAPMAGYSARRINP